MEKSIEDLKNIFSTGEKPTEQDFGDVFDSFHHKSTEVSGFDSVFADEIEATNELITDKVMSPSTTSIAIIEAVSSKEDAFDKNTAFNKNFGEGYNDVSRGDHDHQIEEFLFTDKSPGTVPDTVAIDTLPIFDVEDDSSDIYNQILIINTDQVALNSLVSGDVELMGEPKPEDVSLGEGLYVYDADGSGKQAVIADRFEVCSDDPDGYSEGRIDFAGVKDDAVLSNGVPYAGPGGAVIRVVSGEGITRNFLFDNEGSAYSEGGFYTYSGSAFADSPAAITSAVTPGILGLVPVTYTASSNAGRPDNPVMMGFEADQLDLLFPEVVAGERGTTTQSIDYGRLTVPLVKAFQEREKVIEDLAARVTGLETEVNK